MQIHDLNPPEEMGFVQVVRLNPHFCPNSRAVNSRDLFVLGQIFGWLDPKSGEYIQIDVRDQMKNRYELCAFEKPNHFYQTLCVALSWNDPNQNLSIWPKPVKLSSAKKKDEQLRIISLVQNVFCRILEEKAVLRITDNNLDHPIWLENFINFPYQPDSSIETTNVQIAFTVNPNDKLGELFRQITRFQMAVLEYFLRSQFDEALSTIKCSDCF